MATFREVQTRDTLNTPRAADAPSGTSSLLLALCAALVVCCLPYLVPGLESLRAWTPQDGVPFAGFFRTDRSGPLVGEASGGLTHQQSMSRRERDVMSLLEEQPTASLVQPAAGSGGSGGGKLLASAGPPKIHIPEKLYKDAEVLIDDPHDAMEPFYRALARTARKEAGAITRIAHWGDSAVAPDDMCSVTRTLLQKQFGDAGHGFILVAPATRWYHHHWIYHRSSDWRKLRITHRHAKDGRYGFGGVRAVGNSRSRLRVGTSRRGPIGHKVSRFDVLFLKGPRQGRLVLTVDRDKKKRQQVNAASETWQDAVHTVRVPDGPHELQVRIKGGPVSVYGVALERDGPGVVYDNVGLVGAFGSRMLNAATEHWKNQLATRRPDLMILMFGGNTLSYPYWRPDRYRKSFDKVVRRFRTSRPGAACLVMTPVDHGEHHRNRVRTKPRLLEMVAIQRKVALQNKCAFYSLFDAMGGEGSMGIWIVKRPRLAMPDLAHVTYDGAKVLGTLFYKALMAGFAHYLERQGKQARLAPAPAPPRSNKL
jgi:lysophospholipase L1-like esterase